MSQRTLILSRRDVKTLLPMKDSVAVQEEVFAQNGQGKAWMGPSVYTNYPDPRPTTYPYLGRLMAGGIEPDWRGTKQISYSDTHRIQVVSLFRAHDVLPVAMVEAQFLGQSRTGAGAGVAAKHMARKDARTVGVVGTGETARFSLLALHAIGWPVDKVYVYSRSPENRAAFARLLGERTGFTIEPLDSAETVTRRAEILITGTASHSPVVQADWVQPGTLVLAMGQAEEVDPQLFLRARNVADEIHTALEEGHIYAGIQAGALTPDVAHANLGEVVAGLKPGRTRDDEIIIFDSSGLCIQDMAAAIHVWKRAQELGMGTWADFAHDDPLW